MSEEKEEPKVVSVRTEKINDLFNDYKATVTLDDGRSATAKDIGEANAISAAAAKAKRSW